MESKIRKDLALIDGLHAKNNIFNGLDTVSQRQIQKSLGGKGMMGKERAGHKYLRREWNHKKNIWEYIYKDAKGNEYVGARRTPMGVVTPVGENKQPWQMTRDEYKKVLRIKAEIHDKEKFYDQPEEDREKGINASVSYGLRQHKFAIQDAIANGKKVPSEVLKDYPELIKKEEQKEWQNPFAFYDETNRQRNKAIEFTEKLKSEIKSGKSWDEILDMLEESDGIGASDTMSRDLVYDYWRKQNKFKERKLKSGQGVVLKDGRKGYCTGIMNGGYMIATTDNKVLKISPDLDKIDFEKMKKMYVLQGYNKNSKDWHELTYPTLAANAWEHYYLSRKDKNIWSKVRIINAASRKTIHEKNNVPFQISINQKYLERHPEVEKYLLKNGFTLSGTGMGSVEYDTEDDMDSVVAKLVKEFGRHFKNNVTIDIIDDETENEKINVEERFKKGEEFFVPNSKLKGKISGDKLEIDGYRIRVKELDELDGKEGYWVKVLADIGKN